MSVSHFTRIFLNLLTNSGLEWETFDSLVKFYEHLGTPSQTEHELNAVASLAYEIEKRPDILKSLDNVIYWTSFLKLGVTDTIAEIKDLVLDVIERTNTIGLDRDELSDGDSNPEEGAGEVQRRDPDLQVGKDQ